MIIQTAPPNEPHRVIYQVDHARMSGQFAAAFGNTQFAPPEPRGLLIFITAHHDEGWRETDAAALRDAHTGLPYHLTQTPLPELLKTAAGSPDFNQQHHPYCGLLSSMHTYGLYHGRYGLSDKIFINIVPAEYKTAVQTMLDGELARQANLKTILAQDAETAAWIEPERLFHNYKLLQFFDTLALYFQMVHPEARSQTQFLNVPRQVGDDVTITIKPAGDGVYQLAPYPFAEDGLTFSYRGRLLSPYPPGTDLAAALDAAPVVVETVTIVQGED